MSTESNIDQYGGVVLGAAAQANVVGKPANILIYGGPGTGKSTDAAAAFMKDGRCTAFVIPCEDNALKPIPARGMPTPDHATNTVKSWGHLQATIFWLAANRAKYNAVILDGLSALTNNLYKEATDTLKGKSKWDIPVAVRNCLFLLREWTMQLGLHCVFIGHAKPPAVEEGIFYPGAPLLLPRSMTAIYYALIDTVLRVDYLNSPLPGSLPIRVYHTGGNVWPGDLGVAYPPPPDWRGWHVKNREGVNQAVVPADLGAYLRARQPPYAGL